MKQPYENDFLIGQKDAENEFLASFLSDKMHHSWILLGNEGIGKETFAFKVARFLINDNKESDNALFSSEITNLNIPKTSEIFKLIENQSCPDLLYITRPFDEDKKKYKKEITVEEIRKINKFLHRTSTGGNYRVVIIDKADKMNKNAQNAVLKVLEEPPHKTVILLTAQNMGAFLPTIKSRCRILQLKDLDEMEVSELLSAYCPKITANEKIKIAALSGGSIGKAIDLYESEGLAIYEDLLKFLGKDALSSKEFSNLIAEYALSKNDEKYQILTKMLNEFISEKIKSFIKNTPMEEIIGTENHLLEYYNTAQLMDKKDKIDTLLTECNVSNLDRQTVLLSIFS
jgi:DNA polymerase-3 subunit delta'